MYMYTYMYALLLSFQSEFGNHKLKNTEAFFDKRVKPKKFFGVFPQKMFLPIGGYPKILKKVTF